MHYKHKQISTGIQRMRSDVTEKSVNERNDAPCLLFPTPKSILDYAGLLVD